MLVAYNKYDIDEYCIYTCMQDKTLEHEQQSCFIIILRYFYNFFFK